MPMTKTLAIAILWFGAAARAADAPPAVWLVSTRNAPRCGELNDAPKTVRYWRLTAQCAWSPADAGDFHAGDDLSVPTVVFIHGNNTNAQAAVRKGWYVYQAIRSQSAGRAFRYVIWSWPADRVYRRKRADLSLKAAYGDVESHYLATWLDNLRPGVKVSLVGHSFGPRIIVGAMHLLAGDEVAGRRLPEDTLAAWTAGRRNPIRVMLLAAALDADRLAAGCRGAPPLSLFDQVLVTRNGCDRVLRRYHRLYGRGGPQAMGFIGPCGVDANEKINVVDVSSTVGKAHNWRRYCSASNICSQWARYTFLEP